jgi:hypothetical protein
MRAVPCLLFAIAMLGVAAGQTVTSVPYRYPVTTPSLPWPNPPLQVGASNATAGLTAGAENETSATLPAPGPATNLYPVYYGPAYYGAPYTAPPESLGETAAASEAAPPAPRGGGVETGVWQSTTVDALRQGGYGVSLAEAAAYSKVHSQHATRTYGNSDIERLPSK